MLEYPTSASNDPERMGPNMMPRVNAVSAKAKTLEPAPLGPNTCGFGDSHFLTTAEFTTDINTFNLDK